MCNASKETGASGKEREIGREKDSQGIEVGGGVMMRVSVQEIGG